MMGLGSLKASAKSDELEGSAEIEALESGTHKGAPLPAAAHKRADTSSRGAHEGAPMDAKLLGLDLDSFNLAASVLQDLERSKDGSHSCKSSLWSCRP